MLEKDLEIARAIEKLDCAIDEIIDLYSLEYKRVTVLFNGDYEKMRMLLQVYGELQEARLKLSMYEFTEKN